jgi:hypothetical protein
MAITNPKGFVVASVVADELGAILTRYHPQNDPGLDYL